MPDIAIVATACTTSVGLHTAQTCASVRTGISRTSAFKWNGVTCQGLFSASIPDGCLPELALAPGKEPELTHIEKRILQLAGSTREQMSHLDLADIPLVIGLCQEPAFNRLSDNDILALVASQIQATILPDKSLVIKKGRASGLMAIRTACEMLTTGQADKVLAGGCDSFHDHELLGKLNIDNRMKSQIAKDGFIPGEGAGLVLLMTESAAQQSQYPILGKIRSWATGFEPGHLGSDKPYHGNGLAETVQALFHNHSFEKIPTVYSSMNAESHWAKEWAAAYLRSSKHFQESVSLHHPAEYYGDPGAACGPIMTALAATGIKQGYQQGPALVYASSDHGQRCAIIVER